MAREEHDIVRQVLQAQQDSYAADRLIERYLPFIRAEAAKFLQRPPTDSDDELSIAMIAFHEAVCGYDKGRGAFLPYASTLIRSRLIDYDRKERRHRSSVSLDAPRGEEEDGSLLDTLADPSDHSGDLITREATAHEIRELSEQMESFGVSLADVADNCPRQQRTLDACRTAMAYAKSRPDLLDQLVRTGKLPLSELAQGSGVERKTLERHRKYLMALLLICTNGYEIIRGHLHQVMKGGGVQ
ncbi:MAG: sigma-70 family RNA polymerase sigma factor [Oscillospiraceae bacterium]|nr:sigma-70 family RNA polymerase sigma factor [Oscillospiraceae bacterium]